MSLLSWIGAAIAIASCVRHILHEVLVAHQEWTRYQTRGEIGVPDALPSEKY